MIAPLLVLALAAIDVEDPTGCLDTEAVRQRIEASVARHGVPEDASIAVVGSVVTSTTQVVLRVVSPRGKVVYERSFALARADCKSGPELIAVALDSFLRDLPEYTWREVQKPPERAETVVVLRDATQIGSLFYAAIDGRAAPLSADLELGLTADVGSERHRLTVSGGVRVGLPTQLASGWFIETLALLGAGWRYAGESWLIRAELRTGGLFVAGFGFTVNHRQWLLWLELQAAVLFRIGPVMLGPQVGVAPLMHDVIAGTESTGIPWLRLGLVAAFPIWTQQL